MGSVYRRAVKMLEAGGAERREVDAVFADEPKDSGPLLVQPDAWNPLFLGHFSPVLRRLFTVLSWCPASWRQDGENGRKMA